MSLVIFPSVPFGPREIDPDFEAEQIAAKRAGFATALVDHTRLMAGDVAVSVARVPDRARTAVYRGWMLTPHQYSAMHAVLAARETNLLNSPDAYRTCHYLPESYPFILEHTPRSVWFPVERAHGLPLETLRAALVPFGDAPLIVKDYVKSQKHDWDEACFIPRASDLPAVERVASRFLKLQGEDLNEGLVFRAFVPLQIVGKHPKSGRPLAAEFRIFWLDGAPLLSHRYWGDLTAPDLALDLERPLAALRPIAARIPSRFFTMDLAFLEDGSWTIVELGDGQVAGLPSVDLALDFYRGLAKGLG
jgi:hypothetical protein